MNTASPQVSVCMITYNHGKYISNAIEGFLIQETNFEIELVIGDDCSTDNTRKICEEFAQKYSQINLLPSDKNLGMIANFIRTLDTCAGKYIAICEGDDYWTDPLKLQKQVDFLEANPAYGLISSDVNLIDENGNPLADNNMAIKQRTKRKPDIDFFDLLDTNLINTLTVCVRKDLMNDLTKRIVSENLWFVYDYWFWLNIALKSNIHISYEKTADYRVHSGGISSQNGFLKKRSPFILFDVISAYLADNKTFKLESKNQDILFNIFLSLYRNNLASKEIKHWALKNMLKCRPSIHFIYSKILKKILNK